MRSLLRFRRDVEEIVETFRQGKLDYEQTCQNVVDVVIIDGDFTDDHLLEAVADLVNRINNNGTIYIGNFNIEQLAQLTYRLRELANDVEDLTFNQE